MAVDIFGNLIKTLGGVEAQQLAEVERQDKLAQQKVLNDRADVAATNAKARLAIEQAGAKRAKQKEIERVNAQASKNKFLKQTAGPMQVADGTNQAMIDEITADNSSLQNDILDKRTKAYDTKYQEEYTKLNKPRKDITFDELMGIQAKATTAGDASLTDTDKLEYDRANNAMERLGGALAPLREATASEKLSVIAEQNPDNLHALEKKLTYDVANETADKKNRADVLKEFVKGQGKSTTGTGTGKKTFDATKEAKAFQTLYTNPLKGETKTKGIDPKTNAIGLAMVNLGYDGAKVANIVAELEDKGEVDAYLGMFDKEGTPLDKDKVESTLKTRFGTPGTDTSAFDMNKYLNPAKDTSPKNSNEDIRKIMAEIGGVEQPPNTNNTNNTDNTDNTEKVDPAQETPTTVVKENEEIVTDVVKNIAPEAPGTIKTKIESGTVRPGYEQIADIIKSVPKAAKDIGTMLFGKMTEGESQEATTAAALVNQSASGMLQIAGSPYTATKMLTDWVMTGDSNAGSSVFDKHAKDATDVAIRELNNVGITDPTKQEIAMAVTGLIVAPAATAKTVANLGTGLINKGVNPMLRLRKSNIPVPVAPVKTVSGGSASAIASEDVARVGKELPTLVAQAQTGSPQAIERLNQIAAKYPQFRGQIDAVTNSAQKQLDQWLQNR